MLSTAACTSFGEDNKNDINSSFLSWLGWRYQRATRNANALSLVVWAKPHSTSTTSTLGPLYCAATHAVDMSVLHYYISPSMSTTDNALSLTFSLGCLRINRHLFWSLACALFLPTAIRNLIRLILGSDGRCAQSCAEYQSWFNAHCSIGTCELTLGMLGYNAYYSDMRCCSLWFWSRGT